MESTLDAVVLEVAEEHDLSLRSPLHAPFSLHFSQGAPLILPRNVAALFMFFPRLALCPLPFTLLFLRDLVDILFLLPDIFQIYRLVVFKFADQLLQPLILVLDIQILICQIMSTHVLLMVLNQPIVGLLVVIFRFLMDSLLSLHY